MIQRTLDLFYDELVIGSDLSALSYCYVNQCPAIYLQVNSPYKYDAKNNWVNDSALWNELAFMLSTYKFMPFSDKIVSIRLEDDNLLKAVTKHGLVCNIKYNHLMISNDAGVEGLPAPVGKTSELNWVIDWFDVNCGAIHNLDEIVDDDMFVSKIYFYPSKRSVNVKLKKDLLSVSTIHDFNLHKDDYNQNIARIKIINLMKQNGIKGIWHKRDKSFIPPKLTARKRDIHPLGKNFYNLLPKNIKMLYDSHEKILSMSHDSNPWFDTLKKYGINR